MRKNGNSKQREQMMLDFGHESSASVSEPATDLMKAVALKAPVRKKIERDFSEAEATEIKQRLAEKKTTRMSEAMVENMEEAARKERIREIKRIAKEMEKGNQAKVILFPSFSRKSDKLEWYKLGEFSALYFTYRMADRMGRVPKIMRDTDKFCKMHAVVSVRDVDKVVAQAMSLGDFSRYEKTLDGLYILYLKKPLTDEELGILRRTEGQRREMMHNVLKPRRADAAVYQAILMLDRQVLPRTSKMEKGYYVAIGDTMAKQLHQLTQVYFKFANGRLDVLAAKETILDLIDGLLSGVALLGENNVWGYDVATAIGENIAGLKKLVEKMK